MACARAYRQPPRNHLCRQLREVHAASHTGIDIEVEHSLANGVGVGSVSRELEAATTTLGDTRANVPGHIAHVVHAVVWAYGAGILGLDEFHLHLPEVDEGVTSTPP